MEDYLNKFLSMQQDTSDIDAAKAEASKKKKMLAIGQLLSGLARAKSSSMGGRQADPAMFQQLASAQDDKVAGVRADKQSAIQNLMKKAALQRQQKQDIVSNKGTEAGIADKLFSQKMDTQKFDLQKQQADQGAGLDQQKQQLNQDKFGLDQSKFGEDKRANLAQEAATAAEPAPLSIFEKEQDKLGAKQFSESQGNALSQQNNVDLIDGALESLEQYSKTSLGGTGPIATGMGVSRFFSEKTDTLNSKLKKIDLQNMVRTFAGMAKAIDSDAERRAWQGTQASIANDDDTNKSILLGAKAIILKGQADAEAQKRHVEQFGNLREYESPILNKVKPLINANGEMKLIPNEQEAQARAGGFMSVDEYISGGGSKNQPQQNDGLTPRQQRIKELRERNAD